PVAVLLSAVAPIGLARAAETTPGVLPDWTVLGLGIPITVFLIVALATLPAWRAARLAGRAQGAPDRRAATNRSAIAGLLTGAGVGPSGVAGVRLALERG